MKNNIAIDDFLDGLFTFTPDILLELNRGIEQRIQPRAIAAAGLKPGDLGERKVGILTDPEEEIMVRVFRNGDNQCYRLYFIADDRDLTLGVVTTPESFKYFIIQPDGTTTIPLSSKIDPLKDPLRISLPKVRFAVTLSSLSEKGHLLQDKRCSLVIGTRDEEGERILEIYDITSTSKVELLKLLISAEYPSGENFVRLVPVRGGFARTGLPRAITGDIRIALYP